ncbi:MAG TPA: methylmalonyl-CoA mutase family protein [bacterium]|nr:methylmalonyl-CoA mutase family protein [bacterium]
MSKDDRLRRMAEHEAEVGKTTRREWATLSGRETQPLYGPEADDEGAWQRHDEKLGLPGEFPYTRGPYASMYRGKYWTMRQFAGFGSAQDTNRRFKYLLQHGQTGLSVAFDMPTLMGYDADDPLALGEVGRCGVAVTSLDDMETLFDGVPLDKVSTSMTINGPAAIIWAMYIAAAEKQGVSREKLRGTTQNDILKEYIAQKEYLFPPEPSMQMVVDTIEFAAKEMPLWHAVSVSGYHIREAGSTAAQELAFTLADGFAYVEATMKRGLHVDEFAPRLSFFFNAHSDFFEEICKYRAARRIYAKRMRDKYGARNPASWRLRTHAQTAGCSLTAQQPENNIVRTAYQALAAVLGGTQSLHTNSMDETLALPTEKAVKIALRTQQVLAHETGVADVADPLGGSWYVEKLTDELEAEAEEYFRRIDELGGVVPALEKGFFQQEIGHASYRFQRSLDDKKYVQVGVNEYVEEGGQVPIEILKITQQTEDDQVARVKALRERRDNDAVTRSLEGVRKAAKAGDNLMPALLQAVKDYATLGEIVGVCKEVYGEYLEPAVV